LCRADRHSPACQVFGSTIVADDLHVATAYRRSHGLNVITLEGDRADRKGSLTGGYHDLRRSRLEAIKAERTWRTKHEADAARLVEVRRSINRVDQDLTRTIGQVQVLDARRKQARSRRENLLAEIAESQAEVDRLKGALERLEKDKEEAEGEVVTLQVKIGAVRAEMATEMASALNDEEQRLLGELAGEVKRLQNQLADKTSHRTEVRRQCMIRMPCGHWTDFLSSSSLRLAAAHRAQGLTRDRALREPHPQAGRPSRAD
jgi:structural maintenance of chromosome 3 (chondroitin sulfate proteoglycan 6)